MLDKMNALIQMQRKIQEIRRELESAIFEVVSCDGLVKITMTGAQEIKEFTIQPDLRTIEKPVLEKAIKEAHNRAIKRTHDIATEKMKGILGFDLPGLAA